MRANRPQKNSPLVGVAADRQTGWKEKPILPHGMERKKKEKIINKI